MLLAAIATVAGLAAGLLFRTPYRHLAPPRLRGWALLAGGVTAQLAAAILSVGGSTLVLLSYLLLLGFAARNLHFIGMPIVLLGLALNGLVIGLNGGMPVRADALVQAGLAERDEVRTLDLGAKRHLEEPGDRLTVLGDVVPLAPLSRVVSFGDLLLAVGLGDVVAHAVRRRRRYRDGDPLPGWTPADDDAVVQLLTSAPARMRERAGTW